MDRINQFKRTRFIFGSIEARTIRACEFEKRRKQQRSQNIARNRLIGIEDEDLSNAELSPTNVQSNNVQLSDRMKRLMKWKAEKELKKKIEARNKKPPFVVGIPHYKPQISKNTLAPQCQHVKGNKTSPKTPVRTTRATTKRLMQKKQCTENSNSLVNVKDFSVKKEPLSQVKNVVEKSLLFDNNKFKHEIENSNETNNVRNVNANRTPNVKLKTSVNIKTTITENGVEMNKSVSDSAYEHNENKSDQPLIPAAFSPFITTKRGKINARNEQRERLGLNSSLNNITPTKKNITSVLNSSIETPKTAKYYKYLLNQETDRLLNLCKSWEEMRNNSDVTDDGQYIINQAIGQTKLLINKKFQRFQSLILDCEKGSKELLVTCRDLQGFWDMMSMEIKDCQTRFEKLEKLKMNHWVEEEHITKVVKVRKQPQKKVKINGKSNIRAFIEAAKKQKINQQNPVPTILITSDEGNEEKMPQINFDNSISYINSGQTPGKSILKRTNKTKNISNELNKSTVKVNFNDTIIDNNPLLNGENASVFNSSKILNLNRNDDVINNSLENSGTQKAELSQTFESMSQDISAKNQSLQKKSRPKRKTIQLSAESDESTQFSRVLRSRSKFENNPLTKTYNNSNENEIHSDDNYMLSLSSTLNESKNKLNKSTKENYFTSNSHSTDTPLNQRRSSRKSIKPDRFDECTACSSTKSTPITPKTPKLSSQKKVSIKKIKFYPDKDLITFESPLKSKSKKKLFCK